MNTAQAASSASLVSFWLTALALPVALFFLWRADVIRPGSFHRAGVRSLPEHPWTLWIAGAVLVFLSAPLGGQLALSITGTEFPNAVSREASAAPRTPEEETRAAARRAQDVRAMGVAALGSYAASITTSVILIRVMRRRLGSERETRWLWVRASDVPVGLLALLAGAPFVNAVNIASTFLYTVLSGTSIPVVAHSTLDAVKASPNDPWVWVVAGVAVLAAPIVEEVMYRALLQTALLKLTGRASLAVAVTSLIFGLSHVGAVPWYAMPTLMALGAALGVAYERTRSLGVPIVMHTAFNAANVILATLV